MPRPRHLALALAAVSLAVQARAASTVDDVFSATYFEADAKFSDACVALQNANPAVVLETYAHPSASGPQGQALNTRVCVFGDLAASTVLLALSGVHGAEMFAPAAVQLRVMKDALLTGPGRLVLPSGVKAVFVHAVSPWAAAFGFKENEGNIDVLKSLNGIFNVSAQHPQTLLVGVLDAMNVKNLGTVAGFYNALTVFQTAAGGPNGTQLMGQLSYGQNQRTIGLAYYGTSLGWERLVLEDVVARFVNPACNVVLLDLHTAAGAYGDWFVAPYDTATDALLQAWNSESNANAAVEPIYEAGVGMDPWPFFEFVQEMLPRSSVVRMVWEAGTFPQALYQVNLLMGVYCRFYGDLSINEDNCEAFFDGGMQNPGLWTGPCCQYQNDRIREYFYPHLGQYADWPAHTFANVSKPFTLLSYGLTQVAARTATGAVCPGVFGSPTPRPNNDPHEGPDHLSGGAIAGFVVLAVVIVALAVAVVVLFRRTQNPAGSLIHGSHRSSELTPKEVRNPLPETPV